MTAPLEPNRVIAFVGCYAAEDGTGGGIHVFDVDSSGKTLTELSHAERPQQAGYLVFAPRTATLYAVDERKTDGRGPVGPAAAVHALSVKPADGSLTWVNSSPALGPNPTYLCVDASRNTLLSASHGGFEHVEHVVRGDDGQWGVEFRYDDSTVVTYGLDTSGQLTRPIDVQLLSGHGPDPNTSPQVGGHAQASAHAHCVVLDPSGRYAVVCDKATDRVLVYAVDPRMTMTSSLKFPPQTGPRHLAFDADSDRAYLTCEFSSEVASLAFDETTGDLRILDQVSSVSADFTGTNEPAEIRLHPNGRFVYCNNRGEDSLAWFAIDDDGQLERRGHVTLSRSIHPGLAARSFTFAPSGHFLLLADRAGDLLRSYAVDSSDGSLSPLAQFPVGDPAFIAFAEIPGA